MGGQDVAASTHLVTIRGNMPTLSSKVPKEALHRGVKHNGVFWIYAHSRRSFTRSRRVRPVNMGGLGGARDFRTLEMGRSLSKALGAEHSRWSYDLALMIQSVEEFNPVPV
ncbi:hypothetical protein NMY22_g10814 [Coprinellus aureogranulatus]|nr:hypothetical protein NMY22_g10814 [Coprinellus aureogranulatus]